MWISAGGGEERRPPERAPQLLGVELDVLSGRPDEGRGEVALLEALVLEALELLAERLQSRNESAAESASSSAATPSASSSRVIVRGGHTMTTFQWVIR